MEKQEIINALYKKFNEESDRHFTVQELADYLDMNHGAQFKFVVQALTQDFKVFKCWRPHFVITVLLE